MCNELQCEVWELITLERSTSFSLWYTNKCHSHTGLLHLIRWNKNVQACTARTGTVDRVHFYLELDHHPALYTRFLWQFSHGNNRMFPVLANSGSELQHKHSQLYNCVRSIIYLYINKYKCIYGVCKYQCHIYTLGPSASSFNFSNFWADFNKNSLNKCIVSVDFDIHILHVIVQ